MVSLTKPTLQIRLLGECSFLYGNEAVTGVQTRRLQSLLAYILLHREQRLSRRHLAFHFWPDSSEKQAFTNLRRQLHTFAQGTARTSTFRKDR